MTPKPSRLENDSKIRSVPVLKTRVAISYQPSTPCAAVHPKAPGSP